MARGPDPKGGSSRYFLRFTLTAVILSGMTLFLVLVVLPRRFLLRAGLRESGVSFPSQTAPFPPPREFHREAPPHPPPAPVVVRGPAEVFWGELEPLLAAKRFSEALPLFESYLEAYPEDRGARREYAITLSKAGYSSQAVTVFHELLEGKDDPGIRLLLARELRDSGRLSEASTQYALLLDMDPEDLSLQVEWGRALAWGKRYYEAAEVLEAALSRDPTSVEIGSELARIYYWAGRLADADRVLSGIDPGVLEAAGARPLRDDVTAALAPVEPEEEAEGEPANPSPSSTLEQAVRALAEEDYAAAALLYEEALREAPGDTATWRAYADLLQYRLDDLEGARVALLGLEELGASDPTLQYRLARLELWTGRNDAAKVRLHNLLADLEAGPALAGEQTSTQFGTKEAAEIRALLGDLHRWAGNRALAGETYESALRADSTNPRAEAGLRELGAEAARTIEEAEEPGFGGNAFSLMDSDEFSRVDLGAEGVGIDGNWIWGVRTGTRWLRGLDAGGSLGTEQGFFLELESARWWGWGSVRSGVHLGVEELQPGRRDLTLGGSLFFRDLAGFTTDVRFDHGPAYPLTVTLQSLLARTVQDRLTANMARRMAERWSLSLAGDIGRISSSRFIDSGAESSLRLEGGLSLGRSMNDRLTVGLNTRALTYTRPAPLVDGVRLFWDPRGVVASGLFVQWARELRDDWSLSTRVNPSLAFIDEREGVGYELVPHFSAEAGLLHRGRRFISSMDAFYYQGRFDGYRAYGVRLSLSARDWFREHGTP